MARIAAILAAIAVACTPIATPESAWSPEPRGYSVVTVAEPVLRPYNTAQHWRLYCNAFAIDRGGVTLLATAAHCLHGKEPGELVLYVPPSGWGFATARVLYANRATDAALLQPADSDGLLPLAVAAPPAVHSRVTSTSSYFGATSRGFVTADLGLGWRETSITIRRGWSGSPVLNTDGSAWGIVSTCTLSWGFTDCAPHYTRVTAIP